MKIWFVRDLGGPKVDCAHKPWGSGPGPDPPMEEYVAGMGGPGGVPLPPGWDILQWWAYYGALVQLYYYTYGVVGWGASEMAIAKMWLVYETTLTYQALGYFLTTAALGMAVVAVWWLINPVLTSYIHEEPPLGTYIMAYNERMWWAEPVVLEPRGWLAYRRLAEIPGTLCAVGRNTSAWPIRRVHWRADELWFWRTWREERGHRWFMWTAIDWEKALAHYVGLLEHTGSALYMLKDGYTDIWR